MKKLYFLLLISFSLGFSKCFDPLYTGPLLTPSASNLFPGSWNIQPYLFVTDTFAKYDASWHHHATVTTISVNPCVYLQYGLTNHLDVTLVMNGYYNRKKNQKAWTYGDTNVSFGIQIARENSKVPSIRLTLQENFPSGKYQNLNPNKLGIDSSGSGSYETAIGLNFSKTAYFIKCHPISFRLSLNYLLTTKTHVKGFNTYGGGYNTFGKVNPSNVFLTGFSFEYSFTRKFVYAMDIAYTNATNVKFKGNNGTNEDGTEASNVSPSAEQWSLAPALEYNFSKKGGIIGGIWFTVSGKNTEDFISYVLSLTYGY